MNKRLLLLALPLLALSNLNAAEYYITPNGAGDQDGSHFDHAWPKSAIGTTINTTMGPGDTLYLGSGDYPNTTMTLDSSGTSGSPKTIIGVDTGGGIPHLNGDPTWDRSDSDDGPYQMIRPNGDYWVIENLELSNAYHGIRNRPTDAANHLTFRNITLHHMQHPVFLYYVDNALFENVVAKEYTKHGFRVDRGCDDVTFRNCLADMTGGDTSWWDYGLSLPIGFVSYGQSSAKNSGLVFEDCVARDNRYNGQTKSNGSPQTYYNGDGFVLEGNNNGTSQFTRCIAINNEDGGWDLKALSNLVDCVSIKNYRGIRLWDKPSTVDNCVVIYPFRRSYTNEVGNESGTGYWIRNGHATITNSTFYANTGTGVQVEPGYTGSYTVDDSIIAFSGSAGVFTHAPHGTITLGSGTETYRPGSGTDPDFVNPSITWDGYDDDMNSQTYNDTKGYFVGTPTPPATDRVIGINLSDGVDTFLDPTDVVGVLPTANWNNSTANNETITNLVDDAGVASTADVSFTNTPYYYTNSTATYSAPLDDDSKMMRGTRARSNASTTAAEFNEIPFETYDVYVYWGGRRAGETVPAELEVEYQTDVGGTWTTQESRFMLDTDHQWDGTYDESTATVTGVAVDGDDYVVFRNQTADSFKISGTCGRRTGFNAIQIVEISDEVVIAGDIVSVNLANTGDELAAADVAGYLPLANWNNSTSGNETLTNVHNDAGTTTTIDVALGGTPYYYTNATPTYTGLEADSLMMRGTRAQSNSSATAATVYEVPYAVYDVYVYWGGRKSGETVPAELEIEYQIEVGGVWTAQETLYMLDTDHTWDGNFVESTATTTGTAVDGQNYVVFRNQTADSFKIRGSCGRRTGFNAFQIVEK